MSEPDNTPPKPPTVKTSAVPLKKETVRITLRPSAPPSEPLAPVAPPPPTAQVPAPAPPAPPAPPRPIPQGAPTVPLRPAPPAAPTVSLGAPPPPRATGPLAPPPGARPTGAPPPVPVGSKTIPLQQAPGPKPTTPVGVGRQTTRLVGGDPSTQALPKATVKLQRTQPVTAGPPTASVSSAPLKTAAYDEEEEEVDEGPLNGMSIVALVGSIAALIVALLGLQVIKPFSEPPPADLSAQTEWKEGNVTESWKIPADYNPYHSAGADGAMKLNASGNPISIYNEEKTQNHALPEVPKVIQ